MGFCGLPFLFLPTFSFLIIMSDLLWLFGTESFAWKYFAILIFSFEKVLTKVDWFAIIQVLLFMGRSARLLSSYKRRQENLHGPEFRPRCRGAQDDIFLSHTAWHTRGSVRQCKKVCCGNKQMCKNMKHRLKKCNILVLLLQEVKRKDGNTKNEN